MPRRGSGPIATRSASSNESCTASCGSTGTSWSISRERSNATPQRHAASLELSDAPDGRYRIEVTVRDVATGATAAAVREITIRPDPVRREAFGPVTVRLEEPAPMDPVRVIDHHGVSILFFDFSSVSTREEALARIAAAGGVVQRHPPRSVLALTDVSGSYVDETVVQALGALAKANSPHIKAAAIVGAKGKLEAVRQLIAGMARREFKAFDDADAAKDWLAEQGSERPARSDAETPGRVDAERP